jgi:hypothetical protein
MLCESSGVSEATCDQNEVAILRHLSRWRTAPAKYFANRAANWVLPQGILDTIMLPGLGLPADLRVLAGYTMDWNRRNQG